MNNWLPYKEKIEYYIENNYLSLKAHPDLPIFLLNYTAKAQYDKLWDEIILQCRGIVLDYNWNIVARPFRKFFNYEECTSLPDEPYEVYEKMDGSLGILFHYSGQWLMATRGSFSSDQAIKGRQILNKYSYEGLAINCTYLFEIIYPENRIVVSYGEEEKLVLLGIIHTHSGQEVPLKDNHTEKLGFEVVKCYESTDYTALKSSILENQEGFVVRFESGFRMKIKGEEYLRLHRILTGFSTKNILEYIISGDPLDAVLERVPDEFYDWVKGQVEKFQNRYSELLNYAHSTHEEILRLIPTDYTKKDYALLAKEKPYSNLLFKLVENRLEAKDIYHIMKTELKYEQPFRKQQEA